MMEIKKVLKHLKRSALQQYLTYLKHYEVFMVVLYRVLKNVPLYLLIISLYLNLYPEWMGHISPTPFLDLSSPLCMGGE